MHVVVLTLVKVYGPKLLLDLLDFYAKRTDNLIDDNIVIIIQKLIHNDFKIEKELEVLQSETVKKIIKEKEKKEREKIEDREV